MATKEKDNDTRTNAQRSGLESRTHTPGPWWSVGTGVLGGDKNDPQVIASTETGDVMNVEAAEEQEANARLIAAAPELLRQLKALCVQLESSGMIVPPGVSKAIALAEVQS